MTALPNDRSVIRLPVGIRLQTGLEAETLCVKRLRAKRWLKQHPKAAIKARLVGRPALKVVQC